MDIKEICKHNLLKRKCNICRQLCEHGRNKSRCKDCDGVSLCKHGREKYYCKLCKGNGICEHNKYRRHCKFCKNKKKDNMLKEKIAYYLNDIHFMINLKSHIIDFDSLLQNNKINDILL